MDFEEAVQLLRYLAHLIVGFLQQGGHPQKPKGPLEALRPKLQVRKLTLIAFQECTYLVLYYCCVDVSPFGIRC